MRFATEMTRADAAAIERAAAFLREGEVVAFPTETVYGLGADAFAPDAVAKIFEAKGRPADNPLIVHIADTKALPLLTGRVQARAERLIERFWPGPLTLLFEKSERMPEIVTAGLPTIAVRMPSHPIAAMLIRAAGTPIAAPSANRSGKPSPTTALHVLEDMGGRIPMILDGGACDVGLESTVLDLTGEHPVVLRPGGVTVEQLRGLLPDVLVDEAVLRPMLPGAQARSPGMKHRHYAPDARVTVVRGASGAVTQKIRALYGEAAGQGISAVILCPSSHAGAYEGMRIYGLGEDMGAMSANLFSAMRALDGQGIALMIAEAIEAEGLGLALMNRLLRAADFAVIDV